MLRGCVLVLVLCALLLPARGMSFNWHTLAHHAGTFLSGLLGRDLDAVDANGDGVLDVDELANHVGARATRADLENLMLLADSDGDGEVTRRELQKFTL